MPGAIKTIGQVIGVVISLAFVYVSYHFMLGPQIHVHYHFKPTDCVVIDKKLEELVNQRSNRSNYVYRPSFLVVYLVNKQSYKTWTYDILREYSNNQLGQQQILDQVDLVTPYTCWYDPKHPETVVLTRSYTFWAIGFFALATFVALVLISSLLLSFKRKGPN